jgi:hypothetical protein
MNHSHTVEDFSEWFKNELRMFLHYEAHSFCKTTFNCHEYFSEATNGYIQYYNVGSKFATAHLNSLQLTTEYLLSSHAEFKTRMNQECADKLRHMQEVKQVVFDSL